MTRGPDLRRTDLSGYQLNKGSYRYANLEGSRLVGSNLSGSDFSFSNFEGTNLKGANLKGTILIGVTYTNSTVFPDGFDHKGTGTRKVDE